MKNYISHQKKHQEHYANISDEWEDFERRYYKTHTKVCNACNETIHVDLHHIQPRHISPLLIFIESNLIPLCRCCHFRIGHLLNWDNYNTTVVPDSKTLNKQLKLRKNRPKGGN